jgi:hypothetical protein
MDPFIEGESIRGFLKAIGKGEAPQNAVKAGVAAGNEISVQFNKNNPRGYDIHRPSNLYESKLKGMADQIEQASATPVVKESLTTSEPPPPAVKPKARAKSLGKAKARTVPTPEQIKQTYEDAMNH